MATFLTQVFGRKVYSKRFTRCKLQGAILKSPTKTIDKVLKMSKDTHHNLKLVRLPQYSRNNPAFLPRKLIRKTASRKAKRVKKH